MAIRSNKKHLPKNDHDRQSKTIALGTFLGNRWRPVSGIHQATGIDFLGLCLSSINGRHSGDRLSQQTCRVGFRASVAGQGRRRGCGRHHRRARPAPRSRRLAQLRAYARAAILVRAGKTLDSAAAEAVLPTGVAIDVHPESRTAVEAALARFRGSRYDVQLTSELGWRLRYGGDDHLLLLAAQMARGRRMAWLAGGARIAGLLAMRDDQHGDVWSVRRLVMTRPVDGGFQVSVLRPDGEVELLGSLTPSGEGNHRLALRSTGRAPVPLAIDGTVSEEAIRFQLRQFATQRAAKLVGEVDPATL